MLAAYKKIVKEAIASSRLDEDKLKKIKRAVAKVTGSGLAKNSDLLLTYREGLVKRLWKRSPKVEQLLVLKKTRTLSGVSVVAVLTRDLPCKSNCLYCPKEKAMPKSYLSNEPAVMRAVRLNFDPYLQVKKRMEVLERNGHDVSKIELIVMGGTFSHLPKKYRLFFITRCFEAVNDYRDGDYLRKRKVKAISEKDFSLEQLEKRLERAKKINITAPKRMVGLTLETRPDAINKQELIFFRKLGCTRVEMGVQNIYDDVLRLNRRGHDRKAIIEATRLLKEMGFKINYHIMPGMYGSSTRKDLKMFQELFGNPDFCPDMLKIYPCVVTKEADLYYFWKKGKYRPMSNKVLAKFLFKVKAQLPPWVRVTRLIRDIPTDSIAAGPNIPNLRMVLKNEGVRCNCIRCREVGRKERIEEKPYLRRTDYAASHGQEIFLEEVGGKNGERLYSFLRLRIPQAVLKNKKALVVDLDEAAIIRELHSYGAVVPIGKKAGVKGAEQHRGLGKALMKEAEKIVKKEFGLKRLAVISAEGTKEYYRRQGFKDGELYLVKEL